MGVVEDRNDVGMAKLSQRADLAEESLFVHRATHRIGTKHLHRHVALQSRVGGAVDVGISALAHALVQHEARTNQSLEAFSQQVAGFDQVTPSNRVVAHATRIEALPLSEVELGYSGRPEAMNAAHQKGCVDSPARRRAASTLRCAVSTAAAVASRFSRRA